MATKKQILEELKKMPEKVSREVIKNLKINSLSIVKGGEEIRLIKSGYVHFASIALQNEQTREIEKIWKAGCFLDQIGFIIQFLDGISVEEGKRLIFPFYDPNDKDRSSYSRSKEDILSSGTEKELFIYKKLTCPFEEDDVFLSGWIDESFFVDNSLSQDYFFDLMKAKVKK